MDIQDLRANINKIDDQMAELFKERMDTALAIAQYKKENKLPVLDRSREREILSRVAELVGEKYQPYAKILYSTLFDMSRSAQQLALGYEASWPRPSSGPSGRRRPSSPRRPPSPARAWKAPIPSRPATRSSPWRM